MQTYNPVDSYFKDIYVVEKIGTTQGWSNPAPDEDFITGYPREIEAFYRTVAYDEPLESDSSLAADAISTIFSAYVSAEKGGAEVSVKTYSLSKRLERNMQFLILLKAINHLLS